MRSSLLYLLAVALGAIQADAQCVDGHREIISPGYTVEYKCDIYRTGDAHSNVASHNECAKLCEVAARSVCSYHPSSKTCVVGRENGQDKPKPGVTYMEKVEEDDDPFPDDDEDPFPQDCDVEKDACLQRETDLKNELAQCKNDGTPVVPSAQDVAAASCPARNGKESTISGREYKIWCGRFHNSKDYRERIENVGTLAACISWCSARAWCTYAVYGPKSNPSCELNARSVAYTTTPGGVHKDYQCAVKK
ncbi:hypothetical protein PCL_07298 [Purpureocillium lilacinum]|uniref:Uncharacterized protein n=1 Tax=Purpureocillium lilacinum TaxID=33203 RepID=A0A2U3DSM1_PURLI|nr:hypothetical protein PCL_07298 [Purpureocillium lilacinum]